jgi:hypothetical protein
MENAHQAPDFSGPYKAELTELAAVIDWLWAEHDKSFVKAGDDQVYAYGGGGYVLVLDERRWGGLIELITPSASLQFKPGEDGKVAVISAEQNTSAIKAAIKDGASGLKTYYQNRYWSTPRTASAAD